jgi:hypothetical protein
VTTPNASRERVRSHTSPGPRRWTRRRASSNGTGSTAAATQDANCALYQIALTRSSKDENTRRYIARRIAEGKTKKEAFRCLKRYIAREVHQTLVRTPALQAAFDT